MNLVDISFPPLDILPQLLLSFVACHLDSQLSPSPPLLSFLLCVLSTSPFYPPPVSMQILSARYICGMIPFGERFLNCHRFLMSFLGTVFTLLVGSHCSVVWAKWAPEFPRKGL